MYNVVQLPGQEAGFLGSAHVPFQVNADPGAPDFRLGDLDLPGELTIDRLDHRAELLRRLDARRRRIEPARPRPGRAEAARGPRCHAGPDPSDVYTEKAFSLLHSPAVRKAFDLAAEDPKLRDRYGRTKLGQSMLLARRLVEAGVRFVTVYDGQYNGQLANWDSHQDVFPRHKNDLLPPADRGFAALIDDLTAAGCSSETLVIAMGEFGRTPKINGTAGRDHWPYLLQRHPGRRRRPGRDRAWLERQARRLPRHRRRHPRRPRRHACSGGWASTRRARSSTSPAGPTSSPTASRSGRSSVNRQDSLLSKSLSIMRIEHKQGRTMAIQTLTVQLPDRLYAQASALRRTGESHGGS